jgi:methylmalonyl-CoA mutase
MTDPLKLASEFPAADYASWRQLAESGLKGASFDKKLVTRMLDGFAMQPLYTNDDQDDATRLIHQVLCAAVDAKDAASGWDIRQLHDHPDPKSVNAAILDDLENGATSVLLCLDAAARTGADITSGDAGIDGIAIHCLADLDAILDDVYTNLATVALDAGAAAIPAAALLAARLEKDGQNSADADDDFASDAAPAFNIDPIGTLAATGCLPVSADDAIKQAADIAADLIDRFPHATAITVNGAPFYNAGATDGQELACLLAGGVTYLRALTDTGMVIDQAAGAIAFNVAVGTDFFAGIAKLRALRLMWSRVLSASGVDDATITINAVSAEMALSKVDPWVNMLRTTVTSLSAGLGGADSVICLPYDHLIGLSDGFARRIARNTQLILQEESNVHRVIDNLTRELASNAWGRFQSLEAKGGIIKALADGSLQKEISEIWQNRANRVATRRDPLTGVSEFPNITEAKVTCDAQDLTTIRKEAKARQTGFKDAIGISLEDLITAAKSGATIAQMYEALYGKAAGTTIDPLPTHRLSESFETLRDRADAHKASTGKFPQIFLANLGPVAKHTARAMFARNFFEAGGIEAITNNGFADASDAAKAFGESGARIAVICGSDPQYADMAADIAKALKQAGATRIYLAGHPGDARAHYEAAGIDDFIFIGADVLAICETALSHLGVK